MRCSLLSFASACVLVQVSSAGVARPVQAEILAKEEPAAEADWRIGNVSVRFNDGHREMWTRNGSCRLPRVGKTGAVAWVRCTKLEKNDRRWVSSEIRVIRQNYVRDFKPGQLIVTDMAFADGDRSLIVASMMFHGPRLFEKYSLSSGRRVAHFTESEAGDAEASDYPRWVEPVLGE